MSNRKNAVRVELEIIRKRNRGKLAPSDVVEFAKNPKTALHDEFEWDNSEAAHQYRLWQAQHVIRVHVTIIEVSPGNTVVHPEFVSTELSDEYRPIVEVLSEKETRDRLLAQTVTRLVSIKEVALFPKELGGVAAAIAKAAKKYLAR